MTVSKALVFIIMFHLYTNTNRPFRKHPLIASAIILFGSWVFKMLEYFVYPKDYIDFKTQSHLENE